MRYVSSAAAIATALLISISQPVFGQGSNTFSIVSFMETGEVRVDRTHFYVTSTAVLQNVGPALNGVTATATSLVSTIQVVAGQGTLHFAPVPAGTGSAPGQVTSSNTFTLLVDRSVPFDWSQVQFTFNAPFANAGPNQTVNTGSTVTLNGSGSTDSGGIAPLTYSWAFVSVPPGSHAVISSPNALIATFVADVSGTYNVQLTVSNGTSSDSAAAVVSTGPAPPVANAGPNQTVGVGATVNLNGANSTDSNGAQLSYSWTLISMPTRSAAQLFGGRSATPFFVADVSGTYKVQLVVSDGSFSSQPSVVTVTTQNTPPVAIATCSICSGSSGTVVVNTLIRLDGSKSTDADGDPLTYTWSLNTSQAPGSNAVLSATNIVNPTFTVDVAGTYVAQLDVFDGTSHNQATVTITTSAILAPTASAGPNQTIQAGNVVQLSGSGTDPQGLTLTYNWTLTTLPSGSNAKLSATNIANPTFTADVVGTYIAQLVVSNGHLSSTGSTVTITSNDTAPTAVPTVANSGSIFIGNTVFLDGSTSFAAKGLTIASYSWSLSVPSGSHATLTGATTATPTFVADIGGTYVAQLIVKDPFLSSSPATVSINVLSMGIGLSLSPQSPLFANSQSATLTVTLNPAPPAPVTVGFTGYDQTAISISSPSVVVQANTSQATVTVTPVSGGPTGSTTTAIFATASGYNQGTLNVTVNTPGITIGFMNNAPGVGVQNTVNGTITLSAPAPSPGGTTVNISANPESGNPGSVSFNGGSAGQPGTVNVPAGSTTGSFTLTGQTLGAVDLTATASGYTRGTFTDFLVVSLGGIFLSNLKVGSGQSTSLDVQISSPGGAPVGGATVTLISSNPSVLTISPTDSSCGCTKVFIPQGKRVPDPGNVPQITGVSTGQVTITASAAGFTGDTETAQVVASVSFSPQTLTVGAGGVQSFSILLSAPAPTGGLQVNLTSNNPAAATVTPSVLINSGQTSGSAQVTGVAAGPATITGNTCTSCAGNQFFDASGTSVSVTVTKAPAPSITNLSPTSGPVGTPVTITGANFGATQGTSTVTFNGATGGTATSWSATSITINVPAGSTTGNVVVTVSGVASNGVTFTLPSTPSITNLSPTSGAVGNAVTITGTNFGATQGSSAVAFNGTNAGTATSWSATSITINVPGGATTGNVVVTVGGVASNGVSFTVVPAPSITNLSPTSGSVGTAVTITGTNFGATQGASTVKFNGTNAGTATSWSATSITINVPAGSTTGNVVVTVSGVASNGVAFTVNPAPSITNLSPTSGAVGTPVTVTGTNFGATQGTSTVTFNGTNAGTASSWSATGITINVPSGATTGNVVVTVSGVASNGSSFTVLLTPNITNLSPTSGAVGAPVTITGANFGATQGTSTVTFNGANAGTATSWSATSITINVPSGATTGNVVVTVSGVASNGSSFTVLPTPSITNLSPTSGAVGTPVTVTGTNFGATQGASTVTFNGINAGTATSWSATSITINVPSGATTGNVVVSVSGVASNGVAFTVSPAPSITNLSPTSGAVGTPVTITGANFGAAQGTSTVTFNGANAGTATSWSATSITINVPSGATTGNVVVTVSGVASNGSSFTVLPTPSITNLSPTSGAIGTPVTVTGTNFGATQGASTVTFNGANAGPATSWSATSITINVPSGATTGNVVVTVSGVASNGSSFTVLPTPAITNLSPTSGAVGTAVTITGTNFGATQGASTVKFNGTNAGTATSWSATSITINVPVGATTGNVVVTVNGVASNGVNFTVVPAPSITNLSPTSGAVGAAVTVTGTNFGATQGTSTVTFNGTNAGTATSWSATSITINVPSGATTGNVVVTVSGVASNGVSFTVVPAPSITNLSPTSGAVGTPVTITGANFGASQGSSTVTFNGINAGTATSWSATSIAINVPSGATTGNVVVTASGVASNGVAFTVAPAASITNLSPTSGAIGTPVIITGANFGASQGISTVTFNGTNAGTATSWSAISITINVPSGATTGNVVVTENGVASNGVGFTVVPIPSITNLSLTSGAVGTPVTITGTNFGATQGASAVTFNGANAGAATSWSATSITINVPGGATTGNVVVTVSGVASNGVAFTVLPTPSITNLSPTSGAVGTPVTITGTNFGATQGTSTVKFNGTNAGTATSWSATSITINVPSGATTGNVVVTVSGVASNGFGFSVLSTPSITNLSPTSGAVGTPVTITGTNFGATQGTSTVTFNGTNAGIATAWSATSITINVPSGATTGNVVVTVSGVASNGSGFTVVPVPGITNLSPTSGAVGTPVTITGTNFGATQGTSTVAFNGANAGTATSWSATSITINVPAGAATGNVVVTVSGVASNGSSFTVLPTPSITNLSPTSGAVGAPVTITGTNFGATQGTSTVKFNGTNAGTATSWSATSITINVPGGATTGNVVVTVSGVASNGSTFTVLPTPSITNLSPTSGAVGTAVTVTGANFGATQGTSTVTFNGINAGTATGWSATSITINVPAGATTGNVVVTVSGVASNGVAFTVNPAPSITNLSPTSGAVGTAVTVTGANFGASQGTSTVAFNGVNAGTATSWSATSITINVPVGATTGNVVVTVSGVASNGAPFTVVATPSVTSVTPNAGPVGTQVTIAGTNFGASQGASTVTFNGASAGTATSWSISSITINVPAGATTGGVVVTVGGVASNNNIAFTVTTAPHISSLSPTSGPVGTQVTITGANFGSSQGTSTVSFNGATPRSIINWSATSITAAVPSGATSGNVVVTVNGVASNASPFTVTIAPLVLSPSTLPNGAVNQPYNVQVSASGGTPSYNWSSTNLPSWLTFDTTLNGSQCGTTLTLCGTPTASGPYTFTITVTDSGSPTQQTASQNYTVTVAAAQGGVITVTEGSGTSSNFSVGFGLEVPITITFTPAPQVNISLTIASNNPAVLFGNIGTAGHVFNYDSGRRRHNQCDHVCPGGRNVGAAANHHRQLCIRGLCERHGHRHHRPLRVRAFRAERGHRWFV